MAAAACPFTAAVIVPLRTQSKVAMPTTLSAPRMVRPLTVLAGLGAGAVAATAVLWAYYGTTVFFELVRAGWAACF